MMNHHLKKWILVEALLLTFMPLLLLLYAVPVLLFGVVEMVFPLATDTRTFVGRVVGLLPYLGGIFALWIVWRCVHAVATGKKFPMDWRFLVGIVGGCFATWELVVTSNSRISLLICAPVWFLVGHLMYLRRTSDSL